MGAKGAGGFCQAVKEHVRPVLYGGSEGSGVRRKRGDEGGDDVDDVDGGIMDDGGGRRKQPRVEVSGKHGVKFNGGNDKKVQQGNDDDQPEDVEAVKARRRYKKVRFRQGGMGIKGEWGWSLGDRLRLWG